MGYILKVVAATLAAYLALNAVVVLMSDNPVSGLSWTAFAISIIIGVRTYYAHDATDADRTCGMVIGMTGLSFITGLPWFMSGIALFVLSVISVRQAHRGTRTHAALLAREVVIVCAGLIAINMISRALTYSVPSEGFQSASIVFVAMIGLMLSAWAVPLHPERWPRHPKSHWRTRHDRFNRQ